MGCPRSCECGCCRDRGGGTLRRGQAGYSQLRPAETPAKGEVARERGGHGLARTCASEPGDLREGSATPLDLTPPKPQPAAPAAPTPIACHPRPASAPSPVPLHSRPASATPHARHPGPPLQPVAQDPILGLIPSVRGARGNNGIIASPLQSPDLSAPLASSTPDPPRVWGWRSVETVSPR